MALTYIRFFFAYANSDQNGEGCQGSGQYGGVQFQATIPTSCWPTIHSVAESLSLRRPRIALSAVDLSCVDQRLGHQPMLCRVLGHGHRMRRQVNSPRIGAQRKRLRHDSVGLSDIVVRIR
jgi:hypothetical protein